MLVVHVHVRVRPGRVDDFLAATLVNAQASLGEPGVLRFDVIQDQADPEHVVLTEVYRDDDASAAHKLTPHYAIWRATSCIPPSACSGYQWGCAPRCSPPW